MLSLTKRALTAAAAALGLAGCSPPSPPPPERATAGTTYLVGLTGITPTSAEGIEAFTINTWGVDIRAVCRLPSGWRITAGRGAAPDGVISGEASHGVAWIRSGDLASLDNLILVSLPGPVQPGQIGSVPPTFAGEARLSGPSQERTLPLSASNVRLTLADRCPDPPR